MMSTEYSEDRKRKIIKKEIWPKLKKAHYIFDAEPGPCQCKLADAIMNLTGRPAPLVEGSLGKKCFGPGFLFAYDKLNIKAAENELKNQKLATLIKAEDRNKCRVKLGQKPHNPMGTKVFLEGGAILCKVLFRNNIFSGPIGEFRNKMMKISDRFLQ